MVKSTQILPPIDSVHTIVFDFDGVFTDNRVYLNQAGIESVCCDRRDGLAIDFLRKYQQLGKLQAEIFILSTETNPVVEARASKLKLPCKIGVKGKLNFLEIYFAEKFAGQSVQASDAFAGLVYLGNDLNDLAVMAKAGFSVAPQDAHEKVKQQASLVLPHNGGDAFVRNFVEHFLRIDELTVGEINEFIFNS